MELKSRTLKKEILLFAILLIQFANNNVKAQNWSIEYVLKGDSTAYTLSQSKIIQGKPVKFLFPAYKYYQTSSNKAIESKRQNNEEIIEVAFNLKPICFDNIFFEADLYAENVDTIQVFLKTGDNRFVSVSKQATPEGYTYLPTISASINLRESKFASGIASIQIVGKAKSKNDNPKLILGRLNGLKKINVNIENRANIDSFLSKYPVKDHLDLLFEHSGLCIQSYGFGCLYQLTLKDCQTVYDSIQCISQYMKQQLNEYKLYEVYDINKQELINMNTILADTSKNLTVYYNELKKIIASLNCCHMRLTNNQTDVVESPSQPVYFYNINNEIVVSAIFDPTLNKIQLGDKLISINNIPIERIYKDFSKDVFASTPQQREMKITQRLLYTAREVWGDSLRLEFQNNASIYSIYLDKTNFSVKKVVPQGFKFSSKNTIEKYDNIIYFRPDFDESILNPFMYSHKEDFNNCKGLIIDLRGNSGGDFSCLSLFSFLISKNSPILNNESSLNNGHFNYIVKPSKIIQIQKPIVIIIDARTTCVGELLINALRKSRANVFVIGASNTAGSAQLSISTMLSKNVSFFHFDGITKDAYGHLIDDNRGIVPDTLIRFDSYKDLFPYEDRLKCVALKYLGYDTMENIN
jgi:C-terminal processing protease CtpA/Prc